MFHHRKNGSTSTNCHLINSRGDVLVKQNGESTSKIVEFTKKKCCLFKKTPCPSHEIRIQPITGLWLRATFWLFTSGLHWDHDRNWHLCLLRGWKTARVVASSFENVHIMLTVGFGWGLGGMEWDGVGQQRSSYFSHALDATLEPSYVYVFWGLGGVAWGNKVQVTLHTHSVLRWSHQNRLQFCIVTDGAPSYPKLTAENNVGHEACNHSKGFFRIKKKKRPGHPEVAISGPVELMECGRFPTVPSEVLGTQEWRWQSSIASRDLSLAMEMAQCNFQKLFESHRTCPEHMFGRLQDSCKTESWPSRQEHKTLQIPYQLKYPSIFPGKINNKFNDKTRTAPQRHALFIWKGAQPTLRFRRDVCDMGCLSNPLAPMGHIWEVTFLGFALLFSFQVRRNLTGKGWHCLTTWGWVLKDHHCGFAIFGAPRISLDERTAFDAQRLGVKAVRCSKGWDSDVDDFVVTWVWTFPLQSQIQQQWHFHARWDKRTSQDFL